MKLFWVNFLRRLKEMTLINGPSKHLSWNELKCRDGTSYPNMWRKNRAIQLAEVFELIRDMCGNGPIEVLSAYRTPSHNKKIGGARKSQHLEGRALDLRPPIEWTVDEFYNIIKYFPNNTTSFSIRGIGKYKTFVHVDIRPTNKTVYWFGIGVKDDRI